MRVVHFRLGSDFTVERSHVYAIGMFDGVHLGHRQVINTAIGLAKARGMSSGVITFDRHPSMTLGLGEPGVLLMSREQRLSAFSEFGLDTVVVLCFDKDLASMSPAGFVREVLLNRLSLGGAVVGENHSFGRAASGQASDLMQMGRDWGFAVEVVLPVIIDGEVVSSTLIRQMLARGAVADAARYLGRPYRIDGTVIEGQHLGRRLGFPTMNICPDPEQAMPARGVYVASVAIEGEEGARWGICNVGMRPTVSTGGLLVEVHVLDFDSDSYGKTIRISFMDYIRGEQRFASLQQLSEAIASDERLARKWIACYENRRASRTRKSHLRCLER